jgi:hypothetical protein
MQHTGLDTLPAYHVDTSLQPVEPEPVSCTPVENEPRSERAGGPASRRRGEYKPFLARYLKRRRELVAACTAEECWAYFRQYAAKNYPRLSLPEDGRKAIEITRQLTESLHNDNTPNGIGPAQKRT